MQALTIAGQEFTSRLFLGTGKFGSSQQMEEAIIASGSELVTVALKRVDLETDTDSILSHLQHPHIHLLPNTSGARSAKEAVFAAQLAREALETNWLKLEIHPDPRYLMPDAIETLCKRLEDAGTAAVMPLGSPIGSNKGLRTIDFLEIIIEQSKVPVIIDAGIGAPSDAAKAMEIGADAVLVNTAIAVAGNPVEMAFAFRLAVQSGRMAYEAKLGNRFNQAIASSPLTAFLGE